MSYTEWISRMAAALSHNDDYIVLGELYALRKELEVQEAASVSHWSDR